MMEFFDEDMLPTPILTRKKGLTGTNNLIVGVRAASALLNRLHDVNPLRLDLIMFIVAFHQICGELTARFC